MRQTTMTALAIPEHGKVALMDMPMPTVPPDAVLIRVAYSGVSAGTEMWIGEGRRHDYGPPPFVNGYQVTGEIVEAGDQVEGWAPGDRVAAFVRGAHAPYALGRPALMHRLADPDADALPSAIFVAPAVGANAINHASVNAGDVALVVGQGLIGQATAQLLRLRGALVIAADVAPDRLAISRQSCADHVLDVTATPASEQIRDAWPHGVDVVFESTGFNNLIQDAMACVRQGGRFVFEGFYPGDVSFPFHPPHAKQIQAFFPCFIGPPPVREAVLRLIHQGRLDTRALISHVVPWRDAEAVYADLFTPKRNAYNGIVIDWTTA